jgi:hypothetical protein
MSFVWAPPAWAGLLEQRKKEQKARKKATGDLGPPTGESWPPPPGRHTWAPAKSVWPPTGELRGCPAWAPPTGEFCLPSVDPPAEATLVIKADQVRRAPTGESSPAERTGPKPARSPLPSRHPALPDP